MRLFCVELFVRRALMSQLHAPGATKYMGGLDDSYRGTITAQHKFQYALFAALSLRVLTAPLERVKTFMMVRHTFACSVISLGHDELHQHLCSDSEIHCMHLHATSLFACSKYFNARCTVYSSLSSGQSVRARARSRRAAGAVQLSVEHGARAHRPGQGRRPMCVSLTAPELTTPRHSGFVGYSFLFSNAIL
jgi:hypothetical protein